MRLFLITKVTFEDEKVIMVSDDYEVDVTYKAIETNHYILDYLF